LSLFRSWVARRGNERGVSLVELVSVTAVLLVLAGVAMPVASTAVKRYRELELRRALREIREAIDRFQLDTRRYPGMVQKNLNPLTNQDLFPEKLEHLYEGVDIGDAAGTKLKYLRRLPLDPMTGTAEWRTRSSRDRPKSLFSDGVNIFDVRSTSDKVALDGTSYGDW
jgi:general secretion pathway protein G